MCICVDFRLSVCVFVLILNVCVCLCVDFRLFVCVCVLI